MIRFTFGDGDTDAKTDGENTRRAAELIEAEEGQSVGAALIAAGHRSWRTTRHDHQPRGIFCGIGICFDCVVTVNGRPNQRACLTEVHDGDTVTPQEGAGRGHLAC